jgi:hypothetical protein
MPFREPRAADFNCPVAWLLAQRRRKEWFAKASDVPNFDCRVKKTESGPSPHDGRGLNDRKTAWFKNTRFPVTPGFFSARHLGYAL